MTDIGNNDITHVFFPTLIRVCEYPNFAREKTRMLEAAYQIRDADERGREKSQTDYTLGYTSYFTETNLKEVAAFKGLAAFLQDKAVEFAQAMRYDLSSSRVLLSKFWININPKHSFHPEHIHAHTLFSGVFYLSATPDSGSITFKDPREVRLMVTPPTSETTLENTETVSLPPTEGNALLFPAWLTHSVQQNPTNRDRVSLAYNFRLKSLDY